jgi:hypothetical protein
MRWQEKILLAAIVLLAVVSNVRVVGAEDDCGMPTWQVVRAADGVLWCIGEGW